MEKRTNLYEGWFRLYNRRGEAIREFKVETRGRVARFDDGSSMHLLKFKECLVDNMIRRVR